MARHEDHKPTAEQPQEPEAKQANEQVAKEQEQGYRGVAVDPNPNEAYSIQTGPDSPTTEAGPVTQHHLKEA